MHGRRHAPPTGKSRDEMGVMRQRVKLEPQAQGACRQLVGQLPDLEATAQHEVGASKAKADVALYQARKRYFDLRC